MTLYQLDIKQPILDALDRFEDVTYIERRVVSWLTSRGYVLGPLNGSGVVVNGSGHVTVDTDRDPTVEWAAFNPETPTTAEAEEDQQREQATQLYQALRAGTATNRQVQGVVAWLLRRELGV